VQRPDEAEERDTGRLLRCCYEELKARAGNGKTSDGGRAVQADLDRVEQKVDALCDAVGELRALVVAGTASSNGNERKASAKAR
jgi:hypothetical protein